MMARQNLCLFYAVNATSFTMKSDTTKRDIWQLVIEIKYVATVVLNMRVKELVAFT